MILCGPTATVTVRDSRNTATDDQRSDAHMAHVSANVPERHTDSAAGIASSTPIRNSFFSLLTGTTMT
uniref:Uncharacterized protein n=1 Tax=Steinernema glaseri TaxID=37863 RepID=A0A1I7ZLA1_9BILA